MVKRSIVGLVFFIVGLSVNFFIVGCNNQSAVATGETFKLKRGVSLKGESEPITKWKNLMKENFSYFQYVWEIESLRVYSPESKNQWIPVLDIKRFSDTTKDGYPKECIVAEDSLGREIKVETIAREVGGIQKGDMYFICNSDTQFSISCEVYKNSEGQWKEDGIYTDYRGNVVTIEGTLLNDQGDIHARMDINGEVFTGNLLVGEKQPEVVEEVIDYTNSNIVFDNTVAAAENIEISEEIANMHLDYLPEPVIVKKQVWLSLGCEVLTDALTWYTGPGSIIASAAYGAINAYINNNTQ